MTKTLIWDPVCGPKFLFISFTSKLLSYAMSRKLTELDKNDKKPNFGPDFRLFGPNLGPQAYFAGFTSTIR